MLSSVAYELSLWRLVFLAPLGLTVDYCQIQWRHSSRKLLRFPCGLGLPVLSGLSTVDFFLVFPRVFSPGVVMAPSHGFNFAGLVVWLLVAPRSWKPPSRSTLFSRFVTFWRFCAMRVGVPLVPSRFAVLLG